MAGVKGRSGRRSNFDEEQKLRVLRKAWDFIEKLFDDPSIDPATMAMKRDVAGKLVVKNVPSEVSGALSVDVIAMGNIIKETSELKFNIGVPIDQVDTPQDS